MEESHFLSSHDSFGSIPRSIVPKGQFDDSIGTLISDFGDSTSFLFEDDWHADNNDEKSDDMNSTKKHHFEKYKSGTNSNSYASSSPSMASSLTTSSSKKRHAAFPRIPRLQGRSTFTSKFSDSKSLDDSFGSIPQSISPNFPGDDSFRTLISDFADSTSIIFEEEWMQLKDDDTPAADPLEKFRSDSATFTTQGLTSLASQASSQGSSVGKSKPIATAMPRIPRRRPSMKSLTFADSLSDLDRKEMEEGANDRQNLSATSSRRVQLHDSNCVKALSQLVPPKRPNRYSSEGTKASEEIQQ